MISIPPLLEHHGLVLTSKLQANLRDCFTEVAANEGTLWLFDEPQHLLVPVWNSGPRADRFIGKYGQPLSSGLISVAFITEQALCENRVCENSQQDPTLDNQLGFKTWAMIAVPLYFRESILGIVSCVKLIDREDQIHPPPFSMADLLTVTRTAFRLEHDINSTRPASDIPLLKEGFK